MCFTPPPAELPTFSHVNLSNRGRVTYFLQMVPDMQLNNQVKRCLHYDWCFSMEIKHDSVSEQEQIWKEKSPAIALHFFYKKLASF